MEEQVGSWTIPAPLMRVETFTLAGYTTSTTELPQQALTKLHLEGTMMPF